MGECAYCFKMAFVNKAAARKAYPIVKKFLTEGQKAYDYWQKNRDKQDDTFWAYFGTNYPLVAEYVKTLKNEYKNNEIVWGSKDGNALASNLDFGEKEDIQNLRLYDTEISYDAPNAWHMSDWTGFVNFLKTKCSAIKAVWDKEENGCANAGSLNLFDWETIVKKIIKCKPLLPQLIGLDDDLDELLQYEMKK